MCARLPVDDNQGVATRVLIVDDHAGFRASARMVLEGDGFEIVGEAETGEGAIACAHDLSPDVVLLDIGLPDIDGLEVASRLTSAVILCSSRSPEDIGPAVERSGALGFIPKAELSGAAVEALLP